MNTVMTLPEGTPAATCSACDSADPSLPCELANGGTPADPASLRCRVRRGEVLIREGDPCRGILAVRSGTFKTVIAALDGHEQVTGFQLAGDVLGLDGLAHGRHASRAIALEDSEVVVLPYDGEGEHDPHRLGHLLPRLIGRELVRRQKLTLLLACMNAEQRLASFLLNLSRRLQVRGYSAAEFHLRMSRGEIASYLGLNLETVSRTFSLLQQRGLIGVDARHVVLRDRPALVRMFDPSRNARRAASTGARLDA
jgi:CRP/FNR family transcriptional regulator